MPRNSRGEVFTVFTPAVYVIGDHPDLVAPDGGTGLRDGAEIEPCDVLNGNVYWHPRGHTIQSLPLEHCTTKPR